VEPGGAAAAVISGAREARPSPLRRLVARAAARDLRAFVVPGPDVARARGLDLEAAGLRLSDTPRHASVLVLVGELPAGLKEAAAVAYAQMPRPRAILAVGAGDVSPLPEPDVSAPLGQEGVVSGVGELRRSFAEGAFAPEAPEFDVDAVRTQPQYVCPMHPEVVRGEPGSCPICGMDLVPRESAGDMHHGHMGHGHMDHERPGHEDMNHGDMGQGGAKGHDEAGHEHARHGDAHAAGEGEEQGDAHDAHEMHEHGGAEPEEHGGHHDHEEPGHEDPGREHGAMEHAEGDHGGHERHGGHEHMGHGDMGFMSMVAMTKDLPRSGDGLPMEWVEAPLGPLFPGLPGGLSLTLTLDGDTVAQARAQGVDGRNLEEVTGPVGGFAARVARLDPLSPVAYRLLATRAVEEAAGTPVDERTALARVGALERERAASHLNWLAGYAHLLGYAWLENRAASLQLALLRAPDAEEIARLRAEVLKLGRRVGRTPLLRSKLRGIGSLSDGVGALGPVARGSGQRTDARAEEEVYSTLGFEPVFREGGDAFSRLLVRLEEAIQTLDLVRKAGSVSIPALNLDGAYLDGVGAATVETPRGAATLGVTLEAGEVTDLELETPSSKHLELVSPVAEGEELADALVGVASLDISPWEVLR
jgi:Ni,Fe-hydrogenase III large subunit